MCLAKGSIDLMSILEKCVVLFLKTAVSPLNLLSHSTKLVVGVSGGPDSLALLHVLTQVVEPTRLVVAHLNHGYRKTAVSEAAFVRDIAHEWGVAFETQFVDVTQLAKDAGDSLEDAGRKARYAFFRDVADKYETPYIVVGHHGDDQAETVLMNLLRGAGLRGLRGMLPVAPIEMDMAESDRYFVLRPFLSVNRQEIETYCQENKLSPVFDESNEDVSFFRNRIRQELLPLLADYNAGIRTHLQQLAELSAADVALIDGLASDAWAQVVRAVDDMAVVIDRMAWGALPLGLRRAILRQAVVVQRPFLQDITFQAIEQARLIAERHETGQRFSLPGDLFLLVDYDRLIVTANEQIMLDDCPQMIDGQSNNLPVPGTVELADGWKLQTKLVDKAEVAEIETVADKWLVFVSMPVNQSFIVRTREPGERFQPLGMNGRSAKLKEVMINRKVPRKWRENWPIIANEAHLVWFVGHSIDERVKITKETESIVKIHCFKG